MGANWSLQCVVGIRYPYEPEFLQLISVYVYGCSVQLRTNSDRYASFWNRFGRPSLTGVAIGHLICVRVPARGRG